MRSILVLACVASCLEGACFQDPLEDSCPEQEDVAPCVCTDARSSFELACQNIYNGDILRRVFKYSDRHHYSKVTIRNSVFQYIPHEIFHKTPVSRLVLRDSILTALFDSPPTDARTTTSVDLTNVTLSRGISWRSFEHMESLEELHVVDTSVRILDPSLSRYVSKSLTDMRFIRTTTTQIKQGALSNFTNLDRLELEGNQLGRLDNSGRLARDLFPRPFNVDYLNLRDNSLSSLPGDLFVDMPRLGLVNLERNRLTSVPQSAFAGVPTYTFILLNANFLKCDCLLQWIVKKELVRSVEGYCSAPKRLLRKKLGHLTPSDFRCKT